MAEKDGFIAEGEKRLTETTVDGGRSLKVMWALSGGQPGGNGRNEHSGAFVVDKELLHACMDGRTVFLWRSDMSICLDGGGVGGLGFFRLHNKTWVWRAYFFAWGRESLVSRGVRNDTSSAGINIGSGRLGFWDKSGMGLLGLGFLYFWEAWD